MNFLKVIHVMTMLRHKDMATYLHSMRVGKMAELFAEKMDMNGEQSQRLVLGCTLHDIGKLMIPNPILKKKSKLAPKEYRLVQSHCRLGAEMLEGEDNEILNTILHHHERWDGKGYPAQLSGGDIPAFARICAILDAFDCMINDRPYRTGGSLQDAKRELYCNANSQFDPFFVECFLAIRHEKLVEAQSAHNEPITVESRMK